MTRKISILSGRLITVYLIIAMFVIAAIPSQSAAMFITPGTGGASFDTAADISTVETFLESNIVRQRLSDFGLTAEEIYDRLSQLSPQQLHHIATHIEQIDIGGDSALGVLISLLVIAILVIVVMKLMGRQVIIK